MDYETIRAKALALHVAVQQANALMKELLDAGVKVYYYWHERDLCIRVSHDIPLEDE